MQGIHFLWVVHSMNQMFITRFDQSYPTQTFFCKTWIILLTWNQSILLSMETTACSTSKKIQTTTIQNTTPSMEYTGNDAGSTMYSCLGDTTIICIWYSLLSSNFIRNYCVNLSIWFDDNLTIIYSLKVAKENGTTLPAAGLFVIRYHSFYREC